MRIAAVNFYTKQNKSKNNYGRIPGNQFSYQSQQPLNIPVQNSNSDTIDWIKDKNLSKATNQLNYLKFNDDDVKYIQSLGIVLPFMSGKEAVDFIRDKHIMIKFAPLPNENTHAQFDYDNNCIKINQIYRNAQNTAEILAISEAILHEAGHAKDQEGQNTLQEEIDCLALNALSHRIYSKNFSNVFSNSDSLIVKDGVCIYADLFFNDDPLKTQLVDRLNQKYGYLPIGDFKHPPSNLALAVKNR